MDAPTTIDDDHPTGNTHQFDFGGQAIRVLISDSGAPIWVAKDVCEALGLSETDVAMRRLNEEEKGACIVRTPGGPQEMTTINEPGLYRLIFRSRKDEAEKFQDWVFGEVLPEIRRTGRYAPDTPPDAVAENHEHRLTRMERKIEALRDDQPPAAVLIAHVVIQMCHQLRDRGVDESTRNAVLSAWWQGVVRSSRLTHDQKQQLMSVWHLLDDSSAQLPAGEHGLKLVEDATG